MTFENAIESFGNGESAEKSCLQNALGTIKSGKVARTPYEYHSARAVSWDYTEDDWTKRLKYVLEDMYRDMNIPILLTASSKATCVNPIHLDVKESTAVYPLRGAPDIIIRNKAMVMQGREDEEPMSSADEAIENTQQRSILKSKGPLTRNLPEKMGELFAALHFLLVSKVIRAKQNGKEKESYSKRGLLIDRMCCTITGTLTGGINKELTLQDIVVNKAIITPAQLCTVLDKFVRIA